MRNFSLKRHELHAFNEVMQRRHFFPFNVPLKNEMISRDFHVSADFLRGKAKITQREFSLSKHFCFKIHNLSANIVLFGALKRLRSITRHNSAVYRIIFLLLLARPHRRLFTAPSQIASFLLFHLMIIK